MDPRPISAPLAAALVVLGIVLAIAPAFLAGFAICGISGCSGGGFGRSTDPGLTRLLLLATGVVAGLPLALYALVRRSIRLAAYALALRAGDRPHRAGHRLRPPRLPARRVDRDVSGGVGLAHSHSMVPGGFEVMSRVTRLTSATSLVMRVEMRSITS